MSALKLLLAPGSMPLLVLAIAIGVIAMRRRSRFGRAGAIWIGAWLVTYSLLSLPLVARQLYSALSAAPVLASSAQAKQFRAVVVLGGGAARYRLGDEAVPIMSVQATLRVLEAARVYRLLGSPIVVVSGAGDAEVASMHAGLLAGGVPADRITSESRSRDTHDSAQAVAAMLRARQMAGAVLVTSEHHIPRAMRAFRSAGVDVVAAPAPALPIGAWGSPALLPDGEAFSISRMCLHEYAGILYYKLRRWA